MTEYFDAGIMFGRNASIIIVAILGYLFGKKLYNKRKDNPKDKTNSKSY